MAMLFAEEYLKCRKCGNSEFAVTPCYAFEIVKGGKEEKFRSVFRKNVIKCVACGQIAKNNISEEQIIHE